MKNQGDTSLFWYNFYGKRMPALDLPWQCCMHSLRLPLRTGSMLGLQICVWKASVVENKEGKIGTGG